MLEYLVGVSQVRPGPALGVKLDTPGSQFGHWSQGIFDQWIQAICEGPLDQNRRRPAKKFCEFIGGKLEAGDSFVDRPHSGL